MVPASVCERLARVDVSGATRLRLRFHGRLIYCFGAWAGQLRTVLRDHTARAVYVDGLSVRWVTRERRQLVVEDASATSRFSWEETARISDAVEAAIQRLSAIPPSLPDRRSRRDAPGR